MSLTFPYWPALYAHALITLRGGSVRHRPIIAISILGPTNEYVLDGLLDTSADDTVFSELIAEHIGLDLTNAPVGVVSGGNQQRFPVRYAEVGLRLYNPHEQRDWRAWVAFTATPLRRPLLGQAGLLEYFDVLFSHHRRIVELTVNPSYPGT